MRVVVTGIGVVSPLGLGIKHAWKSLLEKRCGIVKLGSAYEGIPSQVAGLVPVGSAEDQLDLEKHFDAATGRKIPLFAKYAMIASKQALQDAAWAPQTDEQLDYSGVCIGSGVGGLEAVYENAVKFHEGGYRKVSPLFVPMLLPNMAAGHVSISTGFRGPNHAASTACTTGAHCIGDAFKIIKDGQAKVMLAGSTEACVHPLAVSGFARARSLATKFNDTPEQASRPFDSDRDGFVIGEGAAVLVLENEEHAIARGAKIYAEISGYGMSGDAHHITAPSPDGRGAKACMTAAIRDAGISGPQIDYVNAHATSTVIGDAIESRAIFEVLDKPGEECNVSSTKGATGHLLGAAGSLEAVFCVMALKTQTMPPSLNIDVKSLDRSKFNLNYITEATPHNLTHVMTNSFGFGGTNASLVISKYD